VSILLGRGDGTFQAVPDVAVGTNPVSITVGDFNGDGHQDLATANAAADTVSILLGRGDGSFRAAQSFGAGFFPNSITVGDFNGDGHQDLATANRLVNIVSVLLGRGDGTFEAAQSFNAGLDPFAITAGDFNGDGHQDLATANIGPGSEPGTVSILLGRGDGTFQAPQDFEVRGPAFAITAGDFNSDGQPDLATASRTDNTVSILINNTFTPIVVTIDIKPGNFPNRINPRSHGVIPVAILTTSMFDATMVDPLSVKFGPKGATEAHGRGHIEDADGDGDLDLVLHFRTQETGITCGATSASLTGETLNGQPITGSDSIKTVGCNNH
jgi:hypothetical protein